SLLHEDAVRAAVAESFDAPDPEPIAEAVLDLVAIASPDAGELPWLAELALPGQDGEWYAAGEMLLPGSPLAAIVAADAPYGRPLDSWVQRWGERALIAAGVLRTLPIVRAEDVVLGETDLQLPDESDWYDAIEARLPATDVPPGLEQVVAVGDLDLVADWARGLELLSAEPFRSIVSAPAVAVGPDGAHVPVPSYTSWWLARNPVLSGRRPADLTLASAELSGLYDETDADPDLARLVGVRLALDDVLADPDSATDLLHRLADPRRSVRPELLPGLYRRLAAALADFEVDPPNGVRVGPDRVAGRDDVVVLDRPYAAPLIDGVPVGGDAAVADLLDVPLASDLVRGGVTTTGAERAWAEVPGAALAARRCGAPLPGTPVVVHSELRVGGRIVPWWPEGGRDHVDGTAGSLGRALAWRLGRWERRAAAAEAFAHPEAEWPALEDSLER
ncbi:MAG TPA: hypothetical protein VHC49_10670, partial [Mycobacteriales bacterium]|nr:hypothetical protein [Mycobacteriales bacterium]